jgi:hypothetical protein
MPRAAKNCIYGTHISAQPKPPWAKKRGGWSGFACFEGMAERSSRGPEAVRMELLVMPSGSCEDAGGLGDGARHWRTKGPNGMSVYSKVLVASSALRVIQHSKKCRNASAVRCSLCTDNNLKMTKNTDQRPSRSLKARACQSHDAKMKRVKSQSQGAGCGRRPERGMPKRHGFFSRTSVRRAEATVAFAPTTCYFPPLGVVTVQVPKKRGCSVERGLVGVARKKG